MIGFLLIWILLSQLVFGKLQQRENSLHVNDCIFAEDGSISSNNLNGESSTLETADKKSRCDSISYNRPQKMSSMFFACNPELLGHDIESISLLSKIIDPQILAQLSPPSKCSLMKLLQNDDEGKEEEDEEENEEGGKDVEGEAESDKGNNTSSSIGEDTGPLNRSYQKHKRRMIISEENPDKTGQNKWRSSQTQNTYVKHILYSSSINNKKSILIQF